MKFTVAALAALAATAAAAPSAIHQERPRQAASACSSAVKLDAKTNVFKKYKLHPNSFYRKEVEEAAAAMSDASMKAKALKVADIGTFLWM
jgi:cellulose 1,4-beta-cellobiosidase